MTDPLSAHCSGAGVNFILTETVEQKTKLIDYQILDNRGKSQTDSAGVQAPQEATVLEGAAIQKVDYKTVMRMLRLSRNVFISR